MIRKGEMDPRELDTLPSALATDYAAAALHLLERMPREDAKYRDALDQIERWAQRRKSELAAGGRWEDEGGESERGVLVGRIGQVQLV